MKSLSGALFLSRHSPYFWDSTTVLTQEIKELCPRGLSAPPPMGQFDWRRARFPPCGV